MRQVQILILILALFATGTQAQIPTPLCRGEFPNLITGVCYDCMWPLTLAGFSMNFGISGQDYDSGASSSPVCVCANSLSVGIPTSFWEPEFMVETTHLPGCMPLLGGVNISPPYNASEYGSYTQKGEGVGNKSKGAFIHVNEYLNPIMATLGVIPDSPCLDHRGFDVPYMSWADPTWNDDALASLLTPYSFPFAGVVSIASEVPDALAATIGFPLASLFWTAGAWGPMYPTTGNVANAYSPEISSHLVFARLFAKLYAVGTQQTTAGQGALESCGALGLPQFIMDKRQFKTNRIYPFNDNMCTPISRPLMLQEKGAARPTDRDYGYFIFRKKDCCGTVAGL